MNELSFTNYGDAEIVYNKLVDRGVTAYLYEYLAYEYDDFSVYYMVKWKDELIKTNDKGVMQYGVI